jgi:hypothetical protein
MDASIEAFAQHCPNLKVLKLENCQNVTDRAIRLLLTKCSKIKHVTFNDMAVSYRTLKNSLPSNVRMTLIECKNIPKRYEKKLKKHYPNGTVMVKNTTTKCHCIIL